MLPPTHEDWARAGIDMPPGRVTGNVKLICPACHHSRSNKRDRSLSCDVATGAYMCHHSGCDFRGSVGQGRDGADAYGAPLRSAPRRIYRRPEPLPAPPAAAPQATGPAAAMYRWFASRSIPRRVVDAAGVVFHDGLVSIPYRVGGQLVNYKHRPLADKRFWMEADAELTWYGLDDCPAGGGPLYVVEGEMDKLSLAAAGYPRCLSVPNGASLSSTPDLDYFASGLEAIRGASVVVLAGDNDEAGLRLRDVLMQRIGPHRCSLVSWPSGCKDANDALRLGGPGLIQRCLEAATRPPVDGIVEPDALLEQVLLLHRQGTTRGALCGVPHLDATFSLQQGQLTIVTGAPGSGKSTFLEWYLAQVAARNDYRFAIFSPEQWPHQRHVSSLMEKHVGRPFRDESGYRPDAMSEADVRSAMPWVSDHFKLVTLEAPTVPQLLDTLDAAVLRFQLQGVVIDPWNELSHDLSGKTQTMYTSEALRDLRLFARARNIWIGLVAHPTKLPKQVDGPDQGEYAVADAYDISGSSAWFEKADAILSVWRHRANPSRSVEVHVKKVRFGEVGRPGLVHLSFDKGSGCYAAPEEESYAR